MHHDTKIWLKDNTRIGPIGSMAGTFCIGDGDSVVEIYTVLSSDPVGVLTRLREACNDQIKRLVEKQAAENPSTDIRPADTALVDAIIDSGDLGDFGPTELEGVAKMEEDARMPVNPSTITPDMRGVILCEDMTRAEFAARYPLPIQSPQPIEQVVRIPAPMEDDGIPF